MEKRAIGFKIKINIAVVILMVIGGLAIAVGGILIFAFLVQGAIGGAIAGGMIGGGGGLAGMGIALKTLPDELVHIDDKAVYLPKKTVGLSQIKSVTFKGSALTIIDIYDKKFAQGYMKNSGECCQEIINAMQRQQTDQPLPFVPEQPEDAGQ